LKDQTAILGICMMKAPNLLTQFEMLFLKKMDLWNSPLKRLCLLLLLVRTTTGRAMTQRTRKMVGPLFWPPTVSTEATLLSFVFCHTADVSHRVLVNLAIWVHKKPWGFHAL
jgi:hypothetical protein